MCIFQIDFVINLGNPPVNGKSQCDPDELHDPLVALIVALGRIDKHGSNDSQEKHTHGVDPIAPSGALSMKQLVEPIYEPILREGAIHGVRGKGGVDLGEKEEKKVGLNNLGNLVECLHDSPPLTFSRCECNVHGN